MSEYRQVDPKITSRYISWLGYSWGLLLMVCLGVASAEDTSTRSAAALWIGVSISSIMAIGSMFWTGYSREYRRLNPTASVDTISKPSTLAGFAGALFLVAFSMEFFGEGRDILPSALKALVMGLGVAGIMYLMYRKKK